MTTIVAEYVRRCIRPPQQSFFLFGPRGTGKTMWVNREFPDIYTVNLLDEGLYQSYLADISRFAGELRALEPHSWVFVDEIQRLPSLLNEVHRFIEERGHRFVLTGSSARKFRRGGVNLLAGRALVRFMHPFLPVELGSAFDLESVLTAGSMPLIWNAPEPAETLRSYVQTYLKEEIQAEALVRNLPGFARFLPIAGIMHGQTVNISAAARDAGVSRTTAQGYLEILEDTLLAFRLPAFEAKLRVRERAHPKLYFVDPGLARAVRGAHGAQQPLQPHETGALFEGWIASVLRAHRDYFDLFDDYYYWQPAGAHQTEVDFVLRRDGRHVAIEVKHTARVGPEALRGLRAVAGLEALVRRTLVYTGERRMRTDDGIDILPLSSFLEELADGRIWDDSAAVT